MHQNRNVDAICDMMFHCNGWPLYEVGWYGGSCRPIKVNGKTQTVFFCAQLVDKRYVLDTFFSTFLCGMASVLHRKAVSVLQYCNIYSARENHKRNAVVPEVQKSVGCVTRWKTGGCHSIVYSWQFCVSGVYCWFGKGDKYGQVNLMCG